MQKKPILLLILTTIIVFGTPLFFLIYRSNIAYYVKEDYDRLSRWIFIPIFAMLAILVTYKSIKQDIKRNTLVWFDYVKQLPWFVAGFVFLYYSIGFIFSSMLIFLNVNLGPPQSYLVKGKITDKYEFRGKGAKYRFTILNEIDGNSYLFETTWREIDKYKINDPFEKEMKKGFFGFIYSN